jgi:hypothetical protein
VTPPHFWGISCEKSRFYGKKNLIFAIFRGCVRRVRPTWVALGLSEIYPIGAIFFEVRPP